MKCHTICALLYVPLFIRKGQLDVVKWLFHFCILPQHVVVRMCVKVQNHFCMQYAHHKINDEFNGLIPTKLFETQKMNETVESEL